jgi:ribosomal-protein-serine acetyltransferase
MKTIRLPDTIRTERLVLLRHSVRSGFGVNASRPLAEAIFDAVETDRARLERFLPWVPFVRTIGDEEAYLSRCDEAWEKEELFNFGIFLPSGEVVGDCGLHTVSKSHCRAELGYWLVGAHEGKGFATEAIAGLAKAAFSAGFHRLEIRCDAGNPKSSGVAERLGFRLEGELREDCREEDGQWSNTRIYGRLATDSPGLPATASDSE